MNPGEHLRITPISKLRFDALAGYSRKPSAELVGEELEWFSHSHAPVLGAVVRDRTDDDFGWIILAPDAKTRFRWVNGGGWYDDPTKARLELFERLEVASRQPRNEFNQGDETGAPMDFFAPAVSAQKFSDVYIRLATEEGFSPARGLIEAMMHYYEDVDGNFVEQFQTSGFDARFWELYLFALLTEEGFAFDRSY